MEFRSTTSIRIFQSVSVGLVALTAFIFSGCTVESPTPPPVTSTITATATRVPPSPTPTIDLPPTQTPYPTATPYPTSTPLPTATLPPSPTPTLNIEKLLLQKKSNAKILVYEEAYAPEKISDGWWIKDALYAAGYPFTHVKDAIGTFQNELNSPVDWDLILIGEEKTAMIDGPVLKALINRMDSKTPVVFETWKTNQFSGYGMQSLLVRCGVEFYRNWGSPPPLLIWKQDHPILSRPNRITTLNYQTTAGYKDPGDTMRLSWDSRALLLAGELYEQPGERGSVILCQDEMMILQTFMHHNYEKDMIMRLWQNYVDFMLRKRISLKP